MKSGIIVKEGRKYMLRTDNLTSTLDEISFDLEKNIARIKKIAYEIDQALNHKD